MLEETEYSATDAMDALKVRYHVIALNLDWSHSMPWAGNGAKDLCSGYRSAVKGPLDHTQQCHVSGGAVRTRHAVSMHHRKTTDAVD